MLGFARVTQHYAEVDSKRIKHDLLGQMLAHYVISRFLSLLLLSLTQSGPSVYFCLPGFVHLG